MTWLEERKQWLSGARPAKRKKTALETAYSVAQVAEVLNVDRKTVYKWLAVDAPEDAVIPPAAWFKLPSGHIRIYEWAVLRLRGELS